MVAVEQAAPLVEAMDRTVGEAAGAGSAAQCPQNRTMCDQSKRENSAKPGHGGDLGVEEGAARRDLGGFGWFCGGTQRTALVIRQPWSARPSPLSAP